ncbi:MAG: class I SAM-dependent methyltransferase [Acidobacteriaceae bacterium]
MDPNTPNFDSIARAYRWMEYLSFGPMLERCRFRFLSECSRARYALVLGDGDGRFTARLLSENPDIHVDAIDASAAMLAALRQRAQSCCPDSDSRLNTIQADARDFAPSGKIYDMVVSHFFLDCLTNDDVFDLIERLRPLLAEDAEWLVSEFLIPQKGWRRPAARMLVRSLYSAFSVLTRLRIQRIPDYAPIFRARGFFRSENAEYLGGLLVTEVWKREKS